MGGRSPIPPSSAYWFQRSDSISSAAARNCRIAMSPADRDLLLLVCAKAGRWPARTPAPTAAAPANTPPFKKERRLTLLREGETVSFEEWLASGDTMAEPSFSLFINDHPLFYCSLSLFSE